MKGPQSVRRLSGGVQVLLAEPMTIPGSRFVVRRDSLRHDLLERCRSAWGMERTAEGIYRLTDRSPAMSFRLEGPPGSGKNEIVYQLARELGRDLYVQHGHEDLTPEDLSLLLVPEGTPGRGFPLKIHASPLATALLEGGLFFFDDMHRVPERTLAALSSVLDDRRELYSAATGAWIKAADEQAASSFRFCCTVDRGARDRLPAYLEQRTTPAVAVPIPNAGELREMLPCNVESRSEDVLAVEASQERLQKAELQEHGELRERELLARLLRVWGEDLSLRFSGAKADADAGHWQAAAEAFSALTRELPREDELRRMCLNNHSHCLMELGELKEALRVCGELLRQAPDFGLAICTKADIYLQLAKRERHAKKRRRLAKRSRDLYRRALRSPGLDLNIWCHAKARLAELTHLDGD
jgi:MoxR-like ATPase